MIVHKLPTVRVQDISAELKLYHDSELEELEGVSEIIW
jgi:hypothetical protein